MPLVKVVRHGQITLPAAIRKDLQVEEGDYLEAELVAGAVVLRPKALVDRDQAARDFTKVLSKVEPTPAGKALSDEEVLAITTKAVKQTRRELHSESRRADKAHDANGA